MILSGTEIKRYRDRGTIVIDPFIPAHLGPNSYDVCLGDWYYRERIERASSYYNIYSEEDVSRVWEPGRARTYAELIERGEVSPELDFAYTDRLILLQPGETILGHTVEYVGGRVDNEDPSIGITTGMHARSSTGRSLLCVCKGAGFGDVGFISRWTMEITSFSQHHVIPLKVGERIAQIEFSFVSSPRLTYSGRYQEGRDLESIKAGWVPALMLPRLHLSRDSAASV